MNWPEVSVREARVTNRAAGAGPGGRASAGRDLSWRGRMESNVVCFVWGPA